MVFTTSKHKQIGFVRNKLCRNTFAVLYCDLDFENAPHCGRRMLKRRVATSLKLCGSHVQRR